MCWAKEEEEAIVLLLYCGVEFDKSKLHSARWEVAVAVAGVEEQSGYGRYC